MPKIDVEEQLKLRFLQPLPACMLRRVVIWHDADGEFAPEFERLAAEGFDGAGADDGVMPAHGDFERPVRFLEACEGHMFAVKKLINRDDLASDILPSSLIIPTACRLSGTCVTVPSKGA